MEQIVYFDNSATTCLCPSAIERMEQIMHQSFGNPSSLHRLGVEAEHILSASRASVMSALFLGRTPKGRLFFTAGGTEADNLAILGCAKAKKLRGKPRIITTDSEHPAVLNPLAEAEKMGIEIIKLPTTGGILDLTALREAMTPDTILVSLMLVNNETGARYKIEDAFRMAKAVNPDVITHTDAVQGFLKLPFTPLSLGADLVSISAHKVHGPKGVGALWVSDEVIKTKRLTPVILGGGQEDGMRSGTENTIGIAGFAAACQTGLASLKENMKHAAALRTVIAEGLDPEIRLNTPKGEYASHILSLTLPRIKSETMLHYLSGQGICVSSGSACSSHGKHENHVLAGFGLTKEEADCTIRVSLCGSNKTEEAERVLAAIAEGLRTLIRIK